MSKPCQCNGCRVMLPLPPDRFEMGTYEMGYYEAMVRQFRELLARDEVAIAT